MPFLRRFTNFFLKLFFFQNLFYKKVVSASYRTLNFPKRNEEVYANETIQDIYEAIDQMSNINVGTIYNESYRMSHNKN